MYMTALKLENLFSHKVTSRHLVRRSVDYQNFERRFNDK